MDLIDAVIKDNAKKAKELLEQGANPNFCEDKDNITPLHFAVVYGSKKIIPLLIAAGANLDAKMYGGFTPLECAIDIEKPEIMALLQKYQQSRVV